MTGWVDTGVLTRLRSSGQLGNEEAATSSALSELGMVL
jgi:hypothetical protein